MRLGLIAIVRQTCIYKTKQRLLSAVVESRSVGSVAGSNETGRSSHSELLDEPPSSPQSGFQLLFTVSCCSQTQIWYNIKLNRGYSQNDGRRPSNP